MLSVNVLIYVLLDSSADFHAIFVLSSNFCSICSSNLGFASRHTIKYNGICRTKEVNISLLFMQLIAIFTGVLYNVEILVSISTSRMTTVELLFNSIASRCGMFFCAEDVTPSRVIQTGSGCFWRE